MPQTTYAPQQRPTASLHYYQTRRYKLAVLAQNILRGGFSLTRDGTTNNEPILSGHKDNVFVPHTRIKTYTATAPTSVGIGASQATHELIALSRLVKQSYHLIIEPCWGSINLVVYAVFTFLWCRTSYTPSSSTITSVSLINKIQTIQTLAR